MLKYMQVRNARPKDKPYKLSDGTGLYLYVAKSGFKSWRMDYRIGGKRNTRIIGSFPETTLEDARAECYRLKEQIKNGIDISPSKISKSRRVDHSTIPTFDDLANEVFEIKKENGVAPATLEKWRYYLFVLAKPYIGDQKVTEITPLMVLDMQRDLRRNGLGYGATHVRSKVSRVFKHAVISGHIQTDPTLSLDGVVPMPRAINRPGLKTIEQLRDFLKRKAQLSIHPTIEAALDLLTYSMVRPGEVRFLKLDEIDYINGVWRIPVERLKMRSANDTSAHEVPLIPQIRKTISRAKRHAKGSEFAFPKTFNPGPTKEKVERKSVNSRRSPVISENTFNLTLRRMGYDTKTELCAHGFRSTASTILNEVGKDPDVIESLLGHKDRNRIRAIYNRAEYREKRREVLQYWCDLIDDLKTRRA